MADVVRRPYGSEHMRRINVIDETMSILKMNYLVYG
jgi:hypothetical protein